MRPVLGVVLAAAVMLTACSGSSYSARSGGELEADAWPVLDSEEDLISTSPADFGCLVESFPTQYGSYALLPGDLLETTVYTLTGSKTGPSIYVVGGVHGDELAGWYAGILLRKAAIQSGQVYIVAPLNQYGAEHNQRKTREGWDLNRYFPGDPEGQDAQRIAAALYADIQEKRPDLVLDLHEALAHTDGQDNLGNSIICQDMRPIADLVLDLLADSDSGVLSLTEPLDLFGSPPEGSLNRTVTLELGIPVITVETARQEELGARVSNQLHVAEYILTWYNML